MCSSYSASYLCLQTLESSAHDRFHSINTVKELRKMSEPKEEDYTKLTIEEQLSHKAWKARLVGYKILIQDFENSVDEQDPCFEIILSNHDILKTIATDSNVISQETGILAIAKYLQYGGTHDRVEKLKSTTLVRSLCEKGLSSNRAGTKSNTVESILQLVEISDSADWIFEVLSSFFDNRLPKLVAGCVNCTSQIIENFGIGVILPKAVIPCLPKLFAHADKNVRAETTKLTIEIYKWLGEGLIPLLFDSLKPVQQRDLTAEFEKIKGVTTVHARLTRTQQAKAAAAAMEGDSNSQADSAMDIVEDIESKPAFDAYDMLDPVDVLSKIPSSFNLKLGSAKWQDRKEALEELNDILKKAPKLVNGDYLDLVRSLSKALKDANIQVVQLTANAIEYLSKGLREDFRKYQGIVFSHMIDRTKEKKPLVSQALFNAMFSIFQFSSLLEILDDTIVGMKHKTPQIKISSMGYLQKCLVVTTTIPKSSQVDNIMDVGVKLLSDSQEPVRQASTELIGTLMKIIGERELKKLLSSVDDNRLAKVKAVYENVEVAVTKNGKAELRKPQKILEKPLSPATDIPRVLNGTKLGATPSLQKAIPTKRIATSPARRDDILPKAPAKNFTGRTLILTKSVFDPPKPAAKINLPVDNLEELELLKKENALLQSRCEQLSSSQMSKEDEYNSLKLENGLLRAQVAQLESELNDRNTVHRHQDLTIARLNSDLDNAQTKIKNLEQKLEMAKLQQGNPMVPSLLPPPMDSSRYSPFRSPERISSLRVSLQELSSRVNRMSIEGGLSAPVDLSETMPLTKIDSDYKGEEDSWRRAAEVTAELKARIEKMKQRNKMSMRS